MALLQRCSRARARPHINVTIFQVQVHGLNMSIDSSIICMEQSSFRVARKYSELDYYCNYSTYISQHNMTYFPDITHVLK